MAKVYDSNAKPGQSFQTPWGERKTEVSVTSAGEFITARVNEEIKNYKGTPAFTRDSTAGLCALYGATSRREKRDYERARLRNSKPVRKLPTEETT